MKNLIKIFLPVLFAIILAVSCQSYSNTVTYCFCSRTNVSFSEVTSSSTPGLRELAAMLTQKSSEIQKDFQLNWMVTGSGNNPQEAIKNAVDQAIASFTSSILYSFKQNLEDFKNEFTAKKRELSPTLSKETGSVLFTVSLYLTAEDTVTQVYPEPLAVSATYTFECRGKNDTY